MTYSLISPIFVHFRMNFISWYGILFTLQKCFILTEWLHPTAHRFQEKPDGHCHHSARIWSKTRCRIEGKILFTRIAI